MNQKIEIRPIKKADNVAISLIIKSALEEFNSAIEGTAYTEKETDDLYNAYTNDQSIYYVAVLHNEVIGGCGINSLKGGNSEICELQKMYLSPKARGLKFGEKLLVKCLDFARDAGFKKSYLETFPNMESAIKLYEKNGFNKINHSLGNTCHYSCNVWMLKDL